LKSTIFINPAYTESYGFSTLESLIFGKLLTIYRDVDGLSELKDEGYLNYQTAFRTYDDLVNLTKKIIKEIKNGKYNEYVNKEAIEMLEKEVDPEELAKKYAEIIYLSKEYKKIIHNESESKYNNNLEAQSEEIEAVA